MADGEVYAGLGKDPVKPPAGKELKGRYGVSFEEVIDSLRNNKLLDTLDHPNKQRYPNKRIFVVEIKNYAYSVPFVADREKIFLKTIYPSRKYTKKYLKRRKA